MIHPVAFNGGCDESIPLSNGRHFVSNVTQTIYGISFHDSRRQTNERKRADKSISRYEMIGMTGMIGMVEEWPNRS